MKRDSRIWPSYDCVQRNQQTIRDVATPMSLVRLAVRAELGRSPELPTAITVPVRMRVLGCGAFLRPPRTKYRRVRIPVVRDIDGRVLLGAAELVR